MVGVQGCVRRQAESCDLLSHWSLGWLTKLTNRTEIKERRKGKCERNIEMEKESKEEVMNEIGREVNKRIKSTRIR